MTPVANLPQVSPKQRWAVAGLAATGIVVGGTIVVVAAEPPGRIPLLVWSVIGLARVLAWGTGQRKRWAATFLIAYAVGVAVLLGYLVFLGGWCLVHENGSWC